MFYNMKLTKIKGFNFFRSYFDVYNELDDAYKVAFMDALLDRQFMGSKPSNLKGMAKFAYISQTNSIDSQVKGYEDKTKTRLSGEAYFKDGTTPTVPPTYGGQVPPTVQVEEKGKEQYVYEESVFLENWTKCREHYLKKPTNIKKLNFIESNEFNAIKKLYSKEEINEAMQTLFKQERIPVDAMVLRPKHFLEKFDTYYTGKNNTKIYGANV